jgi:hypothetical protein
MKDSVYLTLIVSAHASLLLQDHGSSCATTFLSSTRALEIHSKFAAANIIPDSVLSFTPMLELTVRYRNTNENLGNTFSVLRPGPFSFPRPN